MHCRRDPLLVGAHVGNHLGLGLRAMFGTAVDWTGNHGRLCVLRVEDSKGAERAVEVVQEYQLFAVLFCHVYYGLVDERRKVRIGPNFSRAS